MLGTVINTSYKATTEPQPKGEFIIFKQLL